MIDSLKEKFIVITLIDKKIMEKKVYSRNPDFFKSSERQQFVMVVTPEIASEIYLMSGGNRHESNEQIKYLASQMRQGKWDHDKGLGIGFDVNGKLRNGHHTLRAVVEYGQPIELKIMVGYEPSFFEEGFDSGKSRSVKDNCEMVIGEGVGKYANYLKNILRIRENGFPTNCGAKVYDYGVETYKELYNREGTSIKNVYDEWDKRRKHDPYAMRGVSVAEPATLNAIMYFLIADCKQEKDFVFDFCNKIMSSRTLTDDNMEFLRFALSKAKTSKSAEKFRIEFPDFFKLFARTYLIETGCLKKKGYSIRKVTHIKQMLEAEESVGYIYDPDTLKETLMLKNRKAA